MSPSDHSSSTPWRSAAARTASSASACPCASPKTATTMPRHARGNGGHRGGGGAARPPSASLRACEPGRATSQQRQASRRRVPSRGGSTFDKGAWPLYVGRDGGNVGLYQHFGGQRDRFGGYTPRNGGGCGDLPSCEAT